MEEKIKKYFDLINEISKLKLELSPYAIKSLKKLSKYKEDLYINGEATINIEKPLQTESVTVENE